MVEEEKKDCRRELFLETAMFKGGLGAGKVECQSVGTSNSCARSNTETRILLADGERLEVLEAQALSSL